MARELGDGLGLCDQGMESFEMLQGHTNVSRDGKTNIGGNGQMSGDRLMSVRTDRRDGDKQK